MFKNSFKPTQIVGIIGTIVSVTLFIRTPSFPTPDKLLVFFIFLFASFGQGWQLFKRLSPFVAVILIYESFRSFADKLNSHVNYSLAPHIDKLLFGKLPAVYLQRWLWKGHVQWYDVAFYIPYLLFFIAPLSLALLVWKTRDKYYWQVVSSFSLLFFMAFLTFLIFPAAPPWLAVNHHYIDGVVRISSHVWNSLGIKNFPSFYNHVTPNPVAAIPSLHAAVATLFSIYVFKLYGRRWGLASLAYPLVLYVGVVYEGEHYATDVIIGIAYGFLAYKLNKPVMAGLSKLAGRFKSAYSSNTKSASKSVRE